MSYPCCNNGPCEQGDKPCPTPDACELPEPEVNGSTLFVGLALVFAVLLFLAWLSPEVLR